MSPCRGLVFLAFAFAAGCTTPGTLPETSTPPLATEQYFARGQEPGWILTIRDGRIDYVGNYGDKRISVARPDPRPSFNGMRYATERLVVDVTYVRCNDAMNGQGYAHQVSVTADGQAYSGCGGERRPDWDQ